MKEIYIFTAGGDAKINVLDIKGALTSRVQLIKFEAPVHHDIGCAKIVICGGNGIKTRHDFNQLYKIAGVLGGSVGATKPIVERGYASRSQQVGYYSHKLTANLYIGIGVSGSSQHIAGISECKTIVAINKAPVAEICNFANFSLIGDATVSISAFSKKLFPH